jgi:recombination protein RecT
MSNITQREQTIKQGLMAQQRMVKSLFGDKKKADKFLATAAKVATDYKLNGCNTQSIIDACIDVAQMQLDLTPTLSQAYLVPFKTKNGGKNVQLIVSRRGYAALLDRAGWKIKTYIVNEDDNFEYVIDGFEERIRFQKNLESEDETFRYAVAVAKAPDGELFIEVMNSKQIEKHRKVSSNQGQKPSGVWADWFDEMAQKTVLKKLVKKLPMGEELATVVEKDDRVIEAKPVEKDGKPDLNKLMQQPKNDKNDKQRDDGNKESNEYDVDPETGEIKQQKKEYKYNPHLLDNVNPDGTDKEDEEIPV